MPTSTTHRPLGLATAVALLASSLACTGATEPSGTLRLEPVTDTVLQVTVATRVIPAPAVRVLNEVGRPVAGVLVRFAAPGGGVILNAAARTGPDGVASAGEWILPTAAGSYSVTAVVASSQLEFRATAVAGPATTLTTAGGNSQIALPNSPLGHPLRVRATDAFGNPVAGVPVSFQALSTGGGFDEPDAVTDGDGVATSGTWTLGGDAGPQYAVAAMPGTEITFHAIACAGACVNDELAFVRDGKVYVTNLLGDERLLAVATVGRRAQPAWSPDGQQLAFVRYDAQDVPSIMIVNADGTGVATLAAGYHSPSWSPDGSALLASQGGCYYSCETYLLTFEPGVVYRRRIATDAAQPAWSPDGTRIAYVALSGDDGHHVLVGMTADSRDAEALSPNDGGFLDHPSWSPDGTEIAFGWCGSSAGTAWTCGILTVPSIRDADIPMPWTLTTGLVGSPSWSPDGTWIAYARRPEAGSAGSSTIEIMLADGSAEPGEVAAGVEPAWRPRPVSARMP